MRIIYSFFCLVISIGLNAQSDTEIYLFDLSITDSTYTLSNQRNISNNDGYDNQPSFYNDNQVLFASTRNGQTDIAAYNVRDKEIHWINDTPGGSEYSPTKIPNQKAISSIRLDTTGLQRLYNYDFETGASKEIVEDLVIGYHVWYTKDMLLSAVLADGALDLVLSNLSEGTNTTLKKKIGRSLHKIPNSNRISFVDKSKDDWEIQSIDPNTGETEKIIGIGKESEDYTWLLNGTLVLSYKQHLLKYKPGTDVNWTPLKTFNDPNISKISRIAVNSLSTQIAIVTEVSPEKAVQKHVDAFNARDLEAFANCFSRNVVVKRFPDEPMYEGREKLKESYKAFFATHKNVQVEVVKRMVSGNKVVDEERVTIDGRVERQATVYEVTNGQISSMTFIHQ